MTSASTLWLLVSPGVSYWERRSKINLFKNRWSQKTSQDLCLLHGKTRGLHLDKFGSGPQSHKGSQFILDTVFDCRSKNIAFPIAFIAQFEEEVPRANMTIALAFVDRVLLAGKSDPKNMYSSPFGPESQKIADDQWAWIDQTLTKYSKPDSRVGWKFVAGHYPGTCRYFNIYCESLITDHLKCR